MQSSHPPNAPKPSTTPDQPEPDTDSTRDVNPVRPHRQRSGRRRFLIGDVAALTGLTPHALRAWEKVGLLVPHRSTTGIRQYSEDDLARVRLIVRTLRTRHVSRRVLAALLDAGELRPEPGDYALSGQPADEREQTGAAGGDGDGGSDGQAAAHAELLAEIGRLRVQVASERARWQIAMDEVSALVLACDTHFQVSYVNRAFKEALGIVDDPTATPDDWVAHYAFQLLDGSGPFPPAEFPIVRAAREGHPVREVLMLRHLEGGAAQLTMWDAAPVFGPDGAVLGGVAIGRDVTAERRRGQREECLMAVARAAASAPDPAGKVGRVAQVIGALAAHGGVPVVSASLHLLDDATQTLRRVSVSGTNPASRAVIELGTAPDRVPLAEPSYSTGDGRPPLWYDAEQHVQWPAAGIHAWATLPLRARGATFGMLAIGLGTPHVWDAAERAWIEACADAVALAHENDQLFAAEKRRTDELEAVVRGVDLGIVLVSPDGRVLVRNPVALTLTGPTPAPDNRDISRVPMLYGLRDVATGEPVPPDRMVLARALAGETVRDQLRLMRDMHGRERIVTCSGAPVRDASGEVVAAIVTFGDVTLRTRQRELSEQLFARLGMALEPAEEMRELVNAIVDAGDMSTAAVYTTAEDDQSLELLVARNYSPEVATMVERIPADATSIAARALRTRQPQIVQQFDDLMGEEHSLTRQLAERLEANSVIAVPLLARGAVVGVLVASSEHPHAFAPDEVGLLLGLAGRAGLALANARLYQTARTTAAQLDAIINGMAEGVWVCDAQGRIILMNAAAGELMELEEGQLPATLEDFGRINRPSWPDGQPMTPEDSPLSRGLRGEVSTDFEAILHLAATGRQVNLKLSYAPIRDESTGAIVGAVSVGRDITPLRALERARGEFLAIVSHELKTPLTSLLGFLQLLRRRRNQAGAQGLAGAESQDETRAAEEVRARESELLGRIEYQAHRLDRLVGDLLDVARFERGRIEYRWAVVDVAGAIGEAVDEQRAAQPQRRITLALPEEMLLARIDADRIAQVVINLLTNALKYSRAEQPVAVSLGEGTDDLTGARVAIVRVRDYGTGIPREHRDHVFERFYRVPGIEVQSGSGIGLGAGLYVAREIVERHGGEIFVEDTDGPGATFAFTLPLAEPPSP